MNEVLVKTHLIITDIHEEYHIKWCGSIKDTKNRKWQTNICHS